MTMVVPFVDLGIQSELLKNELMAEFQKIIDNSSFVMGPQVTAFERAFADYCGAKYAVGVANGTDALILALRAIGLRSGDEVITAVNTFVATAEAIVLAGGVPVFVDVDPGTWNMDVTQIESKITDRTKAIIPVHLYGNPADMDPIVEIATRYDLSVVEDAAQAHGASYSGRVCGSFGKAACFSFYPAKNLGAFGDAGAIVTNCQELHELLSKLRNHGGTAKYVHDVVGHNSRLDTLQAAVLSIKMRYLPEWNRRRRELAQLYGSLLSDLEFVRTPHAVPNATHVYHLYVIRLERGNRDELRQYLADEGIATGIHYPLPIHMTGAFKDLGYSVGDFPIAEALASTMLSLPMYPELSDEAVGYVADKVRRYLGIVGRGKRV